MMQPTSPVTTPAVSILFILSKDIHLKIIHVLVGSQGSSAGIVTIMGAGRSWVQFSAVARDFALLPNIKTCSFPHPWVKVARVRSWPFPPHCTVMLPYALIQNPRFTVAPPEFENYGNKRFISFKIRTKRERAVTWWNPAPQTCPVLDSSSFAIVHQLPCRTCLNSASSILVVLISCCDVAVFVFRKPLFMYVTLISCYICYAQRGKMLNEPKKKKKKKQNMLWQ
jgi:hypothetical protein